MAMLQFSRPPLRVPSVTEEVKVRELLQIPLAITVVQPENIDWETEQYITKRQIYVPRNPVHMALYQKKDDCDIDMEGEAKGDELIPYDAKEPFKFSPLVCPEICVLFTYTYLSRQLRSSEYQFTAIAQLLNSFEAKTNAAMDRAGHKFTHTAFNSGAFCLPFGSLYEKVVNAYADAFEVGALLYWNELLSEIFRLFLDLDFIQLAGLTEQQMLKVVNVVQRVIQRFYPDVPEKDLEVIVLTTNYKAVYNFEEGILRVKTGLHLVWPALKVNKEQWEYICEAVRKELEYEFGERLSGQNAWNDVVDRSCKGLRMPGSRKISGCPVCKLKKEMKECDNEEQLQRLKTNCPFTDAIMEQHSCMQLADGSSRVDESRAYLVAFVMTVNGMRNLTEEHKLNTEARYFVWQCIIRQDAEEPSPGFVLPEGTPKPLLEEVKAGPSTKRKRRKSVSAEDGPGFQYDTVISKPTDAKKKLKGDKDKRKPLERYLHEKRHLNIKEKHVKDVCLALVRDMFPEAPHNRPYQRVNLRYIHVNLTKKHLEVDIAGINDKYCTNCPRSTFQHKNQHAYFIISDQGVSQTCYSTHEGRHGQCNRVKTPPRPISNEFLMTLDPLFDCLQRRGGAKSMHGSAKTAADRIMALGRDSGSLSRESQLRSAMYANQQRLKQLRQRLDHEQEDVDPEPDALEQPVVVTRDAPMGQVEAARIDPLPMGCGKVTLESCKAKLKELHGNTRSIIVEERRVRSASTINNKKDLQKYVLDMSKQIATLLADYLDKKDAEEAFTKHDKVLDRLQYLVDSANDNKNMGKNPHPELSSAELKQAMQMEEDPLLASDWKRFHESEDRILDKHEKELKKKSSARVLRYVDGGQEAAQEQKVESKGKKARKRTADDMQIADENDVIKRLRTRLQQINPNTMVQEWSLAWEKLWKRVVSDSRDLWQYLRDKGLSPRKLFSAFLRYLLTQALYKADHLIKVSGVGRLERQQVSERWGGHGYTTVYIVNTTQEWVEKKLEQLETERMRFLRQDFEEEVEDPAQAWDHLV